MAVFFSSCPLLYKNIFTCRVDNTFEAFVYYFFSSGLCLVLIIWVPKNFVVRKIELFKKWHFYVVFTGQLVASTVIKRASSFSSSFTPMLCSIYVWCP